MNEHKQLIRKLLTEKLGDDLSRAWYFFRDVAYEEMWAPCGENPQSKFEVLLDALRAEFAYRKALEWLDREEVDDERRHQNGTVAVGEV